MILTILMVLVYLIACGFLIMVVLLQSGKGGGLSGMLGGASNPLTDSLGSTGAEKTLSKWTSIAATLFFVLALLLTLKGVHNAKKSGLRQELEASAAPAAATQGVPATTEAVPVEPASEEVGQPENMPPAESSEGMMNIETELPEVPIPAKEEAIPPPPVEGE